MKMNPFDYVKAIEAKTKVSDMSGFVPYLANHSLSNNMDTVLLANEMNCHPDLPPECQYDFLYGTVRKARRFGKWHKPVENPHLELVMNHYQVNKEKALEMLSVLQQSDIKRLIEIADKGGR